MLATSLVPAPTLVRRFRLRLSEGGRLLREVAVGAMRCGGGRGGC